MKQTKEFWSGKRPLWQAFWLVWVAGGIFVGIYVWIAIVFGVDFVSEATLITVALLVVIAYQIFCFVSVWRCALNVKSRVWAIISRALVAISAAQIVVGLIWINRSMNTIITGPL